MIFRTLAAVALLGGLSLSPALVPAAGAQTPTATDERLKDRIEYRLETNALVRKYDVKVTVASGVVTLAGDVATPAQKAEAERVARIEGVTRVDNRIQVDPDEDKSVADRVKKGLTKTGEAITDAWITAKVKWFFVGADDLEGSDINVDTRDRVVTLKGTVKSAAGRDKAVALAKDTDGVRRVVNELVIK